MRTLAATVLCAESLVIVFATIVAIHLSGVDGGTAWTVGGILAVACLVVTGLLRHPWAYALGSAVQAALLASGLVVTAMFFLGAVFTLLWATGLYYGHKIDVLRAARTRAPASPDPRRHP